MQSFVHHYTCFYQVSGQAEGTYSAFLYIMKQSRI